MEHKTIDIEFMIVVNYDKMIEIAKENGVLDLVNSWSNQEIAEGTLKDIKEDFRDEIEDGLIQVHLGKVSEGLMI